MKFVLEQLTITDELYLPSSVERGFKYSGPLRMKKIESLLACWLTPEAVLNMDCEHAKLDLARFVYQDLNAIVKKWLDGGLRNLKAIIMEGFRPEDKYSRDTKLDHILEGIETFPWDINNRPEKGMVNIHLKIWKEHNFRDGRDIRRSDGTIATVDYVPDTLHFENAFLFHVWNP